MISKHSVRTVAVAITLAMLLQSWTQHARAQQPSDRRTETHAMKIYLASPLGFSEVGRAFYNGTLIPEVRRLGYEVLDPWTLTEQSKIDSVKNMPYGEAKRGAWRRLNVEIGGNNRAAIDRCDMVLAVLDGVDVDSGTAAEIGYAFAKGKPILGYRGDFRLSADNEGSIVNLQVEYFIRQSGGTIITEIGKNFDNVKRALEQLKAVALKKPK
jgi:nucleoside 2-deoxyribosyltransferase